MHHKSGLNCHEKLEFFLRVNEMVYLKGEYNVSQVHSWKNHSPTSNLYDLLITSSVALQLSRRRLVGVYLGY